MTTTTAKDQYATKQDVQNLQQRMDKGFDHVRDDMKSMFDDVLGVLDTMMTRIDDRFQRVEETQAVHTDEIRKIFAYLDSIEKQLEISDQERLVMGHQLERLDKWVHALANEIGYKLPV